MRALFFGSPAFAVPCLDALARLGDVVAVVSQPDRPAGRGLRDVPPAVKVRALDLGLPVLQPEKIRTPEFDATLRAFDADVAVVVAYGRILPKNLLEVPRRGCLNLHGSLLPRHRGAAPIQWAVASGDARTGVCLMQMDEGLDTGPVYARAEVDIGETDTADSMFVRLSEVSAELLERALPDVLAGRLEAVPQPDHGVTHARLLTKADGLLPLSRTARLVDAHARGMTSWPGPQLTLADQTLKLFGTSVEHAHGELGRPGEVLSVSAEGLVLACGEGSIRISEVQAPSRKRLPAAEFARGAGITKGALLGGAP